MWNPNSEQDLILAQTVNRRLIIESIVMRGKVFFKGVLVLGLCTIIFVAGIWVLSLAFRYSVDIKSEAEKISSIIVNSISKVVIKTTTEGQVGLIANPLLIDNNSVVGLEPNSEVGISANSSVTVSGNVKIQLPRPSDRQLSLNRKGSDGEAPFTNYVIFNSERFGNGEVESRWYYEISNQSSPKRQSCFYVENLGQGKRISFQIAVNGQIRIAEGFSRTKLDPSEVNKLCKWTTL